MKKALIFLLSTSTRLEDFSLTTFLSTLLTIFWFSFLVFTGLRGFLLIDLAGFLS